MDRLRVWPPTQPSPHCSPAPTNLPLPPPPPHTRPPEGKKILEPFLEQCVPSLRRGHANLTPFLSAANHGSMSMDESCGGWLPGTAFPPPLPQPLPPTAAAKAQRMTSSHAPASSPVFVQQLRQRRGSGRTAVRPTARRARCCGCLRGCRSANQVVMRHHETLQVGGHAWPAPTAAAADMPGHEGMPSPSLPHGCSCLCLMLEACFRTSKLCQQPCPACCSRITGRLEYCSAARPALKLTPPQSDCRCVLLSHCRPNASGYNQYTAS